MKPCQHRDTFALPRTILAPEIAEAGVCRSCGQTIIRLAPPPSTTTR